MAFKMKNPSVAKLVKNAGNNRNDKNARGVREDAPKSMRKPKRPQFKGTDSNKSIVQQAPSQFQKDLQKLARKTFDSNPVVQGVKVLKKFGKTTGLTKDIKKKAKKVKDYFGFYN